MEILTNIASYVWNIIVFCIVLGISYSIGIFYLFNGIVPLLWIPYVTYKILKKDFKSSAILHCLIATNNQWNIFRENFERDLDNCERLYKQERDLLKCYNETRATHVSFFSMVNDDVNAEKMIQLQQQAIIQNNRPHYQHSTTTRYGNTYYTNSYSY